MNEFSLSYLPLELPCGSKRALLEAGFELNRHLIIMEPNPNGIGCQILEYSREIIIDVSPVTNV